MLRSLLHTRKFSVKTIKMSAPNSNTPTNPGMVSGHAQYAKGYVEETVGKALGSKDWEDSGRKDSAAGIEEMKVRP